MRVSVVIPAFNEEAAIGDVLSQLQQIEQIDEIIVVDDGSTDGTAELVNSFAGVDIKQHPYNIGNGAAIKTGIRNATGEVVVLMDGDGQHPPSEIPKMLSFIEEYDMVVGARTLDSSASAHRNVANAIFNRYASYIVGHPVEDLTSGFRVINATVMRSFLYLLPNGFSYPTTITIALFRAGYPVKYHPFVSPARIGKSKIRPVRDGLRFMLTLTRLAVFFVPLKIFLPISIVFIVPGATYTLLLLILVSRFSGFGGLVTTIGIFVFLLGLVAEQIAMLRYVNSDR